MRKALINMNNIARQADCTIQVMYGPGVTSDFDVHEVYKCILTDFDQDEFKQEVDFLRRSIQWTDFDSISTRFIGIKAWHVTKLLSDGGVFDLYIQKAEIDSSKPVGYVVQWDFNGMHTSYLSDADQAAYEIGCLLS